MAHQSTRPGTRQQEPLLRTIDGVVVYARKDEHGRPSLIDAIDRDQPKITSIADRLWRRGFGVMRTKSHRAGKVFYLFRAAWPGPREPPEDPFEDQAD
jgi:hypothetical protein